MNTNRVKQLFTAFAQKLPDPGLEVPPGNQAGRLQMLKGEVLVRGDLILLEELAIEYVEMLDRVSEIVTMEGTWSRTSLDDLLAESVLQVAKAETAGRAGVIRTEADRIVALLKTSPGKWHVDMAVAGLSLDCAGQVFGKLQFLRDTVRNRAESPDENSDAGKVTSVFVRACVEAIDAESAQHKALVLADEHLAVLNALFSDWQPSRIHLFRGQPKPATQKNINRVVKVGDDKSRTEFGSKITGTVLSCGEWRGFMKMRGGARVSDFLKHNDTFANRIVAGYVTAGAACVEPKPQLGFLLFAIALESVVLGKQTKTEITYQLSARVAHLLGSTLDEKRSTVEQVNDLYRLRSAIVHSGSNDVSEADVYAIRAICLSSLQTLVTSPNFEAMKSVEELDQWFDDRMLGSA